MLEVRVAEGCRPTGRILEGLLRQVRSRDRAIVCWGAGTEHWPALNGACNRYNKLQQLERLREARILTVRPHQGIPPENAYPVLARHLHHVGGRDIQVCLQTEDAEAARRNGAAYFTQYIPRRTEYRVWVYRRQHLGTYEKILRYPRRYRGVGCNYSNGFAFELVHEGRIPRNAVEIASQAITALGLDFGAVDILQGKDGHFYVLEVNTAPGVEGPDRQVIRALANKIVRWVELGCPRRNGDPENAHRHSGR